MGILRTHTGPIGCIELTIVSESHAICIQDILTE